MTYIIGISALYHESACCILKDGHLIAAAAEERFTRRKHDASFPRHSFRFCLDHAGITIADLDGLGYYEEPVEKLSRQLWAGIPESLDTTQIDPNRPSRMVRERLGYDGRFHCWPHHLSHAASSYYFSGFREAAVWVVDGVGEWATTSYGMATPEGIDLFEQVDFPDSIGLLYAAITSFLGFKVNNGEYKVMGLAPYGHPRFRKAFDALVTRWDGPFFQMDQRYFDYVGGNRMFSSAMSELFGIEPRQPETQLNQQHFDIARSLQDFLNELMLAKATYLARRTGSKNLCMAGGVALNCVANGHIRREGPFAEVFIQPAAGDAGACLGAAALTHREVTGEAPLQKLSSVYLGPEFDDHQLARFLEMNQLCFEDFRDHEQDLLDKVVQILADKGVIGWFQGRMEFGPRALGARSILANPLDPNVRDHLNKLVKKRESFRPFAPSVLSKHAGNHFALGYDTPFMLHTCQVVSALSLPGITHVDGSARPQTVCPTSNPRYAALIERFHARTGCPMLVNTSFNVRGEPIVCTPSDALLCFVDANLDACVLGSFLILREHLPPQINALLKLWRQNTPNRSQTAHQALGEHLYSFV